MLELFGFEDGSYLGQRDDNHLRIFRILKPCHRRGSEIISHLVEHLAVVGSRGIKQEERVPTGRGVDDDDTVLCLPYGFGEFAEDGYFLCAG